MISAKVYQQRRQLLAEKLPDDAAAIIPGAKLKTRNADVDYPFRQNSSFFYLTGFEEPDALLVIKKDGASYLFNQPRNEAEEQWTGRRLGQDCAIEQLLMTGAFSVATLPKELPNLLKNVQSLYYTINQESDSLIFKTIQQLKTEARKGTKAPQNLCDLEPLLSEMRLFKSVEEQDCLRMSANLSVKAHERVIKACKHLHNEGELEAELIYALRKEGLNSMAYPPIVGAGKNACILHYTANNAPLGANDLVLIDAGGEYHNYAADITRTFPAKGFFSKEQRALYTLVLKAQRAGMHCIKPGNPWSLIQDTIVSVLTEGLVDLGILKGSPTDLIEQGAYKPFYMHNSGHWLGLDVHDCGAYKINNQWRLLQPGMVLTVEPGLYMQENHPGLDKKWWNMGIRIEDDILVTETGYENLTKHLATDPDEIEALMQ